ncbi:ABC-F family ATP-binding cassette domain-containing protein [Eggerthellaceae bacterium zg-997]|nr:ABC-F family ATP-binding cassette domain-containing protein [Eggerthellaceae bacterium zg-997]
MQLNLSNIEYTYPSTAEPALCAVTATFPRGWTGIVGDNGVGKTTLALVACGLLRPDAGTVSPPLFPAYCAQDAREPPDNVVDFALAHDSLAVRLRRELAIDDDWPWRHATLSGGQQKRLQVACALWAAPDVLAMDEPTNHVDASTRRAISDALSHFDGIGLLISHDRELLDTLCTQCLFISKGTVIMRPGGYSQASSQAFLERSGAVHARDGARKEKARIEREARRRREEASRAAGKRSLRGIDKHDADARRKVRVAVVTGKDGKAGRLSSRMAGRLEDAEARLAATRVEKRYEANVWLDAEPSRRKLLFRMGPCSIPLGDASLVVPALHIGNTDHIGLVGDNGSGKTTLVRRIVEVLAETTRFLYIPQEPDRIQERAALGALRNLPASQCGRILSVVAQLNSDPNRMLEGDAVSPGEMRKLMLALGIVERPQIVIMDEPTNHLDIESIEALERVLAVYPGALLLISHDAAMVEAVTNVVWRTRPVEGGYELVTG